MEALLILDMINDIVHPDGPNGKQGFGVEVQRRHVIENCALALDKARKAGTKIGFVRVGFSPDYNEVHPRSLRFTKARDSGILKLGTWGTEVHEALAPRDGEFDVVKHRVSPFIDTTLEVKLRSAGIETIYCAGVSTNAVVQSTVREGHDRDYRMVILEDCCSAMTAAEHEHSIDLLKGFATITWVREVAFGAG